MFDYSVTHWSTFLSATVLLTLSPGPDLAYILAQTARFGRRTGLIAMLGIWTGAFVHVVFAAAGISAVLLASATAFLLIKWIGAAYLIWLGVQAFRSKGTSYKTTSTISDVSNFTIYKQGVLIATLNPKVAMFFLAFLPQFVLPGAGPVGAQILLHGSLVILVAAFIEPPIVFLSARFSQRVEKLSGVQVFVDKCLGLFFIVLGIRLLFVKNT
ncbi:MAG: LysE family translocator [Gammaproteobacteria bacterium]|nr:LysE family translocator [Gammaproteobacteria bacterium]